MNYLRNILAGAAAGAAGTTALNAVTYVDMAVRARPASETPQKAVDALAGKSGHPVPGVGEEKQNRLGGLGPLTGSLTGVGVGALAGLALPLLKKLPSALAVAAIGATAMALTDGPLVSLGLAEPKKWSKLDWASDLVPHLAYGAVTYATLRASER
jgi:hypothetical protein